MKAENELSRNIITAAIEVHRNLGPGLLESTYEQCLVYELLQKGIRCERQKPISLFYKGITIDCGFRIDLMVKGLVVVELKATDQILPVHVAQILTYLKLTSCNLGLLLNFNVPRLALGIKRFVRKTQ